MPLHHDPPMLPQEHEAIRTALDLTIPQLAYELGVSELTLRRREAGKVEIRREAQLALTYLKEHPPTPRPLPAAKPRRMTNDSRYKVGDRFGLFTITDVRSNKVKRWRPEVIGVRCDCGKEKAVLSTRFHGNLVCHHHCPAREALIARGSRIDSHGDIIDKDGFPES